MGRCCVPGCRGNCNNGPKVRLYSFPRDGARKKAWLQAIFREDFTISVYSKVCELHFNAEDFSTMLSYHDERTGRTIEVKRTKRQVKRNVVPSIFPSCRKSLTSKPRENAASQEAVKESLESKELEQERKESSCTDFKTKPSRTCDNDFWTATIGEKDSVAGSQHPQVATSASATSTSEVSTWLPSSGEAMTRCCVPYCRGNYDKGPKVRVFSLPRDAARRIVWQRAISRSDVDIATLRDPKVCELHFKPECLRTISRYTSSDGITLEAPMGRTLLTEDAVPTIFPAAHGSEFKPKPHSRKRRSLEASRTQEAALLSVHTEEQPKKKPSSCGDLSLWLPGIRAGKREVTCSHNHGELMNNLPAGLLWSSLNKADAGVGTTISIKMTKWTQASLPTVKAHRGTDTTDLGDYDTGTQEFSDSSESGMWRLSNVDDVPEVPKLRSSEVLVQEPTVINSCQLVVAAPTSVLASSRGAPQCDQTAVGTTLSTKRGPLRRGSPSKSLQGDAASRCNVKRH